ncbi:hypothetical protein [Methylocystis parvus]|uniref:hypothetical protein n=1 Tax=Methylocystis parvus TaxID=134 RepID=UPI003C755529
MTEKQTLLLNGFSPVFEAAPLLTGEARPSAAELIELANGVLAQAESYGCALIAEHARRIRVYFQVVEKPEPNDFEVAICALRAALLAMSGADAEQEWLQKNAIKPLKAI